MCSTLAFPCGNGCISCVLNTCELCNKSLGYYPSCSGCLPGYYSDGSVCYEITSNPLTCEEYLGKYNSLITINEFAITQTPSTYNLCENLCQFHLPPSVTNTLGDYFRIVPRDSSIYKITTSNEIQISFQTSCDDCFITLPLSSQPYYIYLQNIEYVLFVYGTPSTIISFNATTEIDKTELVFGENTVKGNYYGVTKCTDYQLNGTWYWFNSQDMNYTLTTYGSNPIIVVQTDTKCISISSNSNTTQVMFIGGEMMYIFCTEPVIYLEIGCNDCGNGTCSTKEGHCICPDGLVNKNGTCSTCGNGIVDEDEECEDGEGCIDCKCGEGYKEHNKTCIINLCGNGIINEGEECDGGIGCELCQCKKFYKTVHGVDCKITFIYEITPLATSIIIYIIIYIIILTLTIFKSNQLQKRIASEEKDYFRGGYIPFLKTGSRYVQIDLLHNYATFNPSQIIFNDSTIRPDVDEIARSKFCITNCRRETMNFVLHGHDEYKFDIVFDPPVGTIRGGQTVVVKVKILIRCTSSIRKLLPISLEWTNWKGVKKSMEEEDLFDKTSGEDDTIIESSDDDSDEEVTKKVTKIHTYITLVAESAVSNKLDYEEVQIEQPPIGSGTFGIVYKATWRKVEIAVKVLKTDLVTIEELMPNFEHEAQLMEQLRCQNIINFIGTIVSPDALCIVTEYCPLGSLRRFIKLNKISTLMKVRFCQDIARGMEYLHTNDIIHHDLKTDNVLVYSKNPYDSVVCKVSDFGTSQAFIESSNTLAIQDVGTPIYMAPEVHKTGKLTLKSDVFSYAICMLELWLTHDPYPIIEFHDGDSILAFVCSGKRVGIPRDCIYREIIKQSWHQNPVKRPKFTEIVDHINQIVIDLLEYKKTPTCGDTTTRTMTLRNSFSRGINKRRTGSMGKKEHSPIKHFKKIKLNNSKIDKKLTQNSYINEPLNDKDTIPLPLNTDFSLIDVDICHQYISPHRLSVTKSSLFKQIPYTPRQSSQNGTNISRNARHSQPSPTQILTSVHTFSKSNQKNIL